MAAQFFLNRFLALIALTAVSGKTALGWDELDLLLENLVQFHDNRACCLYQDGQAIVDTAGGKLILGSLASSGGAKGSVHNGVVEGIRQP